MINLKGVDTGLRLPSILVATNLKILKGVFQDDVFEGGGAEIPKDIFHPTPDLKPLKR